MCFSSNSPSHSSATSMMMKFHFGRNSCNPYTNCTRTNALIDSILSLNDDQNVGIQCDHHSSVRPADRYVLMCQSFYDNVNESLTMVETGNTHNIAFILAIFICVVIIIGLSMNTFRLSKKLKKYQSMLNRESMMDKESI